MKYFIVLGELKQSTQPPQAVLKEHIAYSSKGIKDGNILMTGLQEDQSGGVQLMRWESREMLDQYLEEEPLRKAGIQQYQVIEFTPHYIAAGMNADG